MPDGPPPPRSFLPGNAPFTPAQRAWLDGFFAGLLAPAAATVAPPVAARPPVAVLFASQSGTAERLAKKFAKALREKGYSPTLAELGSLDLPAIAAMGNVAVIASTYGEGEPPDGAKAFAGKLEAAQGTLLQGLSYSVLALGDSSYARFCRFGRDIDERFAALGATRLADCVESDVEVEPAFAAFRDGLMALLDKRGGAAAPALAAPSLASSTADASGDDDRDEDEERWTRANPFAATLLSKDVLNGPKSDKETRHIALSLAGSELRYTPGDALGVMAPNSPSAVAAVLEATGLAGDTTVQLPQHGAVPLSQALARHLAIGKLAHATVIKFQKLADSAHLAPLLEPDNVEKLRDYLWGRELVDLLVEFPRAVRSAQELVDLLPRQQPRLYSISSSQAAHPDEVHLTVATVRYEAHGRPRGGVASTYFADWTEPGATVPVYIHRNPYFRLPADPDRPVVMIGPGTGIAPFRAFLQQRRADRAAGKAWLFFGDRRAAQDYLYRRELEAFRDDGTLSRLDAAFSRDGPDKVYVQHRMAEAGAELWAWLQDGAHIYVCGDAERMAKDVDATLRDIVVRHGRKSEAQARLFLEELITDRRYCRDTY